MQLDRENWDKKLRNKSIIIFGLSKCQNLNNGSECYDNEHPIIELIENKYLITKSLNSSTFVQHNLRFKLLKRSIYKGNMSITFNYMAYKILQH